MRAHNCPGGPSSQRLPCAEPSCPHSPKYPRWCVNVLKHDRGPMKPYAVSHVYLRVLHRGVWQWVLESKDEIDLSGPLRNVALDEAQAYAELDGL